MFATSFIVFSSLDGNNPKIREGIVNQFQEIGVFSCPKGNAALV
jgi:hypothetical protein